MTVGELLERIREQKGPFFMARLELRLGFSPAKMSDKADPKLLQEVVSACRDLGYDPPASVTQD